MCVKVAFTAGCTFDSVEEATNAVSAAPVADDCVNVLFTAGCTFGDVAEATAAAKTSLESMDTGKLGCGNIAFTAVCTV